jgi:alkylation response protein AidB-like acyl-CoA dehydrogenase
VIRRTDYTLSPEQAEIAEHFQRFFRDEVPIDRVREAGPMGFDSRLHKQLAELGALSMGLAADGAGTGAGMVEQLLVAQEFGAVIAPVPFVETVVTLRLLEACANQGAADALEASAAGTGIATLALQPRAGRQLVPAGAIARWVVGRVGEDLVLLTLAKPAPHVRNQASAPLAWIDLDRGRRPRVVLARGDHALRLYARVLDEWRLLTAGALVGLAGTALDRAVEYAKVRHAFGVPIGTFQAVANSLVDASIGVEGARNLGLKAAWYRDHRPAERAELASMTFLHAGAAAYRALTAAIHAHGAAGLLLEGELPEYFQRVHTWSLLAGDPTDELDRLAALRYGPAGARSSTLASPTSTPDGKTKSGLTSSESRLGTEVPRRATRRAASTSASRS